MSNDQDLTSLKELASQLKASDALLKKIIKDFEIETIREQKLVCLSAESVKVVRDILALRASGKKNNEIKELFYASKGIQTEKEKSPVAETEEDVEVTMQEAAPEEQAQKKNLRPKKPKLKDKKSKSEPVANATQAAETKADLPKLTAEEIAEFQEVDQSVKDSDEGSILDLNKYLDEDPTEDSELKNLLEDTEADEALEDLEDEAEIESADEVEEIEDKLSPRKIRRRQFSFRYIQRQIATDSKRVNYIKQKLKRGKLSAKERMLLEDSLHHRSMLLNGWIHMLRWVKS